MENTTSLINPTVDESSPSFKRRKFYRKRVQDANSDEPGPAEPSRSSNIPQLLVTHDADPSIISNSDDEKFGNGAQMPVSEILRRRRLAQKRRAGIEFTNATPIPEGSAIEATPGDEILDNEDSFGKILTVVDRFAPQTGQVADVNKHMYALPKSYQAPLKMQLLTV